MVEVGMKHEDIDDADAKGLERLLKGSGARVQPSADKVEAVRASTHAVWREVVATRQRRRRHRQFSFAAAAGVAAVAAGLWLSDVGVAPEMARVQVAAVQGSVEIQQGPGRLWHDLTNDTRIHEGSRIRTDEGELLALTIGNASVRMDSATRIALISDQQLRMTSGALYVDAGAASGDRQPLVIQTADASVRHVGTQYEVRSTPSGTRVNVREGRVELTGVSGVVAIASAGEQLQVTGQGVEHAAVDVRGSEWHWAQRAAPPYIIEGHTLHDFLSWVGRETGRPVVFADPASEAEADRTILSGSIAGLPLDQAIITVISSTRLSLGEDQGKLLISLPQTSS